MEGFYSQDAGNLIIDESYFKLLTNGKYRFRIDTNINSFEICVEVERSEDVSVNNITFEEGYDVVAYIGNIDVQKVSVNNSVLSKEDYKYRNYTLTISKAYFCVGDNLVTINGDINFVVTIVARG